MRNSRFFAIWIAFIGLGLLGVSVRAQAPAPGPGPTFRALRQPARGQAAIEALGTSLPEVARFHGMTAGRLKTLFQQDSDLNLDNTGHLFYTCEPFHPGDEA